VKGELEGEHPRCVETMKLNGLGNCYPSLEIPGHILRVLEGKPWAKSRTNLLLKALGMTNFSDAP